MFERLLTETLATCVLAGFIAAPFLFIFWIAGLI